VPQSGFFEHIFCLVAILAFHLLSSTSNNFVFVSKCNKVVNLKFANSLYDIVSGYTHGQTT